MRAALNAIIDDQPCVFACAAGDSITVGSAASGDCLAQPVLRDGHVIGAVAALRKHGDDPLVSSMDLKLVAATTASIGVLIENATLYEDQRSMFLGTLRALTSAIDAKDRYTRGHSERVAYMATRLGDAIGLDAESAQRLHIAGLVHDVGKIGVPEAVLGKPGRLTDDEFALIKLHPEIGHRILKDIPQFSDILPGVLYHHERWDGRGYPHGIKGDEIPMFARLIAIADSFDAMSSTRTYRSALPREKVLDEIAKCGGTQFDPQLSRFFVDLDFAEYDRMVARHKAAEQRPGAAPMEGEAAA
jgi:HD-GYP domain-containing protein (c-di-GMP phosphodiesterase class II)